MKTETVIRDYKKEDKQGCLNAFDSNVPLYFTEEEIGYFENFLNTIQSRMENNCTRFYVVEYGKQIVGCGGFGDKDNTGIITLAWGLVHNDFHKIGLGKKLLLYRLQQIISLHPGMPVYVDTTQFSFQFFEKYGFVTTKVTEDFYTVGMHRYDMVLYQ